MKAKPKDMDAIRRSYDRGIDVIKVLAKEFPGWNGQDLLLGLHGAIMLTEMAAARLEGKDEA